MKGRSFLYKLIPAALVIVVASLISNHLNSYFMTLINTALIYFLCVSGQSILLGMGGQLSMCSVTFMGLGGFLAAQLVTTYGLPPVAAILLGAALTTVAGWLLGLVLMRLKSGFFVFGTIGLLQIGSTIFTNFKPLCGGPDGIFGLPKLVLFGVTFQTMQTWMILLMVITIFAILLISRIRASSLGRSLMAVRDDEIAAYTLGVNVYRTKVIGFTISCALGGLAGGLLAFHNGVVSSSLFTFNTQLQFIIMTMLGGVNSTIGTLFGTFLVIALPELLRPLANYMTLIYGITVIVLMIFLPMGLGGLVESIYKKVIRARKKAAVRKEG